MAAAYMDGVGPRAQRAALRRVIPEFTGHVGLANALSNANERDDKEKKMTDRAQYAPGPASGAQIRKNGEKWTLILVRELRHSPEKVWQALTDPAHLREWAPF